MFLLKQLAGLLISRQIIGNLRESALPYMMEQWSLAALSFNTWGALTPSKELPPPIEDTKKVDTEPGKTDRPPTPKRSIGQAEIESSYYKVKKIFYKQLKINDAHNIVQLVRWHILGSLRNARPNGIRRFIFFRISISWIVCIGKQFIGNSIGCLQVGARSSKTLRSEGCQHRNMAECVGSAGTGGSDCQLRINWIIGTSVETLARTDANTDCCFNCCTRGKVRSFFYRKYFHWHVA